MLGEVAFDQMVGRAGVAEMAFEQRKMVDAKWCAGQPGMADEKIVNGSAGTAEPGQGNMGQVGPFLGRQPGVDAGPVNLAMQAGKMIARLHAGP